MAAKLEYVCTEQVVKGVDGRRRKAFRFNVVDVSGRQPKLICAVNDVCARADQARELENLFRRNRVEPRHIMDVLEDWIAYRR